MKPYPPPSGGPYGQNQTQPRASDAMANTDRRAQGIILIAFIGAMVLLLAIIGIGAGKKGMETARAERHSRDRAATPAGR